MSVRILEREMRGLETYLVFYEEEECCVGREWDRVEGLMGLKITILGT